MSQGHLGLNIEMVYFADLDYVDNMALLSESCQDLLSESCQDLVDSLETMGQEASKYELEMNWFKTKVQPDHVLAEGATRWSLR